LFERWFSLPRAKLYRGVTNQKRIFRDPLEVRKQIRELLTYLPGNRELRD